MSFVHVTWCYGKAGQPLQSEQACGMPKLGKRSFLVPPCWPSALIEPDNCWHGCRTSNLMQFSWGLENAAASVNVPHSVLLHRAGGYEDRRPAANMDPYLVTVLNLRTRMSKNGLL